MDQLLKRTANRWLERPRDAVLLAGALLFLCALEIVGRQISSEAADLFLCSALAFGVVLIAAEHGRRPVAWVRRLGRGARRFINSLNRRTFRIGVDLRGTPPVPKAAPPVVVVGVAALEVLTLAVLGWIVVAPFPVRPLLRSVSSVGFAAAQFAVWSGLVFVVAGMLIAVPLLLRDYHVYLQRSRSSRRRSPLRRGWFLGGFLAVVVAAGTLLPVWGATLLLAASLMVGVGSVWLPPRREFDFIWQPHGRAVVYSMSWRTYASLLNALLLFTCLLLTLVGLGPAALGLPADSVAPFSLTHLLGAAAAWTSAVGSVVMIWPLTMLGLTAQWRDPAVPAPPRVHVGGRATRTARAAIRRALRRRGWRARFAPSRPAPLDVPVRVRSGDDAKQPATESRAWPREVEPDAFADDHFLVSVAHRDHVQRRRVLLRTLKSLLKRARRLRYQRGSGFWIAPHYWFIMGLMREAGEGLRDDEQPPILEVIPPLYHRAFPRVVRQHFHELCRSVEIDLIFLEDGVSFAGLRRVLRMMFEHFDVHDGRRRIEELHFVGIPRVRVVIHEFELGAEWERSKYPEPDYEDLARARVLHIFKDRGEEEELQETPRDWDRLPAPVPVGSFTG